MKGMKTGGRRKGGKNKKTREVIELLASMKCDPIEGMARIAMDETKAPELRGRMYSELASYCHPKKAAIQHTGEQGGPITVRVVNFASIAAGNNASV